MTVLQNKSTNINLFLKSRGPLATTLSELSITNRLNVDSTTAMRQKHQKFRVAAQNELQCKFEQ